MNPYDLTVEADVVAYMQEADSEAAWNKRCDAVKAANNGYPGFWFRAIILSGVADATAKKWNGDAGIHITTLPRITETERQ